MRLFLLYPPPPLSPLSDYSLRAELSAIIMLPSPLAPSSLMVRAVCTEPKPLIDAFPIRNLCHGLFGRASAKQFIFQTKRNGEREGGIEEDNPLASSPPAAQSAAKIEACDTQEKNTTAATNNNNMIGLKRRT